MLEADIIIGNETTLRIRSILEKKLIYRKQSKQPRSKSRGGTSNISLLAGPFFPCRPCSPTNCVPVVVMV
jgi:hypothetical protein